MLWVRVPPEQLFFSFSMEKELFRLVVLPVLMYIGLRVFMYMYSEDNNYVIKRLV